jgi:hypothetical protein
MPRRHPHKTTVRMVMLWCGMFAQGLINRWELHHRLQFGPVKLAQFLNQPPTFHLPPPYFPENEPLLKAYHAVVNPPRPATLPANTPRDVYDSKYRKDVVPKPAAGAPATPAAKAAEKKSLRNMPGCLCLLALSSYGEARVFVELAAGPSGVEWSSASARLSSHELPDSSSRSTSRATSASDSSSNQAVLCVEQATLTTRNGVLYLAVAEESQIMFFTLKCTYWPLKVTATPHTRTQLKSDIKLQPINAPNPILTPSLIHMGFNPTKPEDFIMVYRMEGGVEAGAKARGGTLRLERLRLKDKPVSQVAQPAPQPGAKAGTAASSDVEALQWYQEQRIVLPCGTSPAAAEETVVTHMTMSNDGQYLVLAYASGKVQLRMLDTLQEAPPAYMLSLGEGAAEGHTWGTTVASCGTASGNSMLLLDSRGRAKVKPPPHLLSASLMLASQKICAHGKLAHLHTPHTVLL